MSAAQEEDDLAREWLGAAARAEVGAAIEEVYAETSQAITERGPACWASGRCCNFAKSGHLLYVTGLEAAYTVSQLRAHRPHPLRVLEVNAAREAGGCPFQVGNLCGVHAIRPLGCRVYFCDRSAQAWQQELYERELGKIRAIHDRLTVTYRYGEWRALLEQLARLYSPDK